MKDNILLNNTNNMENNENNENNENSSEKMLYHKSDNNEKKFKIRKYFNTKHS